MSKKSESAVSSTVTATGKVLEIPISAIMIDPQRNLRFGKPNPKEIEELKASIITEGLHHPLIVSKLAESVNGYEYRLEAGYRRAQAIINAVETAAHAGMVLVHIEEFDSETQARVVNFTENAQRKDQTPMDIAVAIQSMKADGLKEPEIAGLIRKSRGYVNQVGKLTELRKEIQERIHLPKDNLKHIPWTTAREFLTMSEEAQDKAIAELDAGVGGEQSKRLSKKRHEQDDKVPKRLVSAKQALRFVEARTDELKGSVGEEEGQVKKLTKAQETALAMYGLIMRLLKGSLGGQAFTKKVEELL